MSVEQRLDQWVDEHFDEQVRFLQALVQVPTDTPPGNNTPHADVTADLLAEFGFEAKKFVIPQDKVKKNGLESITNLIVRRRYGPGGLTIALNAHGDVVPPGEGWTHDPYGGHIESGRLYGRAAAVSKSDFSTYSFALRALEAVAKPTQGSAELHLTYDEEFGGELGPGWLLANGHTQPDLAIAAGFSYQVVTAHNGCLQLEVTVIGNMAHAAIPESGVDALQGANALMTELYRQNEGFKKIKSKVSGINHPYLNIGMISGGSNTNVVPGKVVIKLDRRMIPEEDPKQVESALRELIASCMQACNERGLAVRADIKRILLCHAMYPLAGNKVLVEALQQHGAAVFGEPIAAIGTPLYTDARLYAERGIPTVMYGAGPRTVLESNAKRVDEHICLADLNRATKVMARTLHTLLRPG
jgi:acetylornithine deacetylase/succinyl-diaminopimelate desuccinylase-like protein